MMEESSGAALQIRRKLRRRDFLKVAASLAGGSLSAPAAVFHLLELHRSPFLLHGPSAFSHLIEARGMAQIGQPPGQ
jgi:hypothetical protein